jgi:hypothetical protein
MQARILDGVYDSLGDTIQALLKLPVDDLQSLLKSLEKIRKVNDEESRKRASNLFGSLGMASHAFIVAKDSPKRIAILTLLCLIINTLINSYNAYHQKGITAEQVEVMIHKAIDSQPRPIPSPLTPPAPRNRAERRRAKHK